MAVEEINFQGYENMIAQLAAEKAVGALELERKAIVKAIEEIGNDYWRVKRLWIVNCYLRQAQAN